jgi:hypothetical protein
MTLDEKDRLTQQMTDLMQDGLRWARQTYARTPTYHHGYEHAVRSCLSLLEQLLTQMERTLEP